MYTVVQHWEVFAFHKVSSLVSQQIRTFPSILCLSSTLLPLFLWWCMPACTTRRDLWSCALCCYTTIQLQRSSNTPSSVSHISSFVGLSNTAFRRLTDGSSTYCQRRKIWLLFHSLLLRKHTCVKAHPSVSAFRQIATAICRKARRWMTASTAPVRHYCVILIQKFTLQCLFDDRTWGYDFVIPFSVLAWSCAQQHKRKIIIVST